MTPRYYKIIFNNLIFRKKKKPKESFHFTKNKQKVVIARRSISIDDLTIYTLIIDYTFMLIL